MRKKILELSLRVSSIIHRKKTKEGRKEYKYGAIVINNPDLVPYIGKDVKVKIEEK